MKTRTNYFPGIKTVLISAFIFIMLSANAFDKPHTSKRLITFNNVSGMTSISGNGLGLRFSPMAGFRVGSKCNISAGPVLRADKPHYAGYLIKGRLSLMDTDESFSGKCALYAFGSFENIVNQYFSKGWNEIEKLTSRNAYGEDFDFRDIRFKGIEVSAGFGVGHQLSESFSMNMEFGIAWHNIHRMNFEQIKLYHQQQGITLHLSLTARYTINRN